MLVAPLSVQDRQILVQAATALQVSRNEAARQDTTTATLEQVWADWSLQHDAADIKAVADAGLAWVKVEKARRRRAQR